MDEFDKTIEEVDDFVYEDLIPILLKKEDELFEENGEGNYMCPFYWTFLELFKINLLKGWTKEELLKDLETIDTLD